MKKLLLTFLALLLFVPGAFAEDGDPVLLPGDASLITVSSTTGITTGVWKATEVGVAYGGTGVNTLAIHGVLIGNAATDITATAVGSTGTIFIGATGADPGWSVGTYAEGAADFSITKGAAILNMDAPLQVTGTGAIITGVDAANVFTMNEAFTIGGGSAGTLTFGNAVTLTVSGQNITLAGVDAARTLTLNEELTVLGGMDIDLHASGGEKAQLAIDTQAAERTLDMTGNLTVESASLVDQDYTSDASPEFADLTLSGGDLTMGAAATAYAGKILLHDADAGDAFSASIQSNANLGASYTLTLPPDDGDNLEVLVTDGSGALNWTENVPSATIGTTVTVTDNDATNETNAVLFAAGGAGSGNLGVEADLTGATLFTYDPDTGTVTATEFVGGGAGITGITSAPTWGAITDTTVTVSAAAGNLAVGSNLYIGVEEFGDTNTDVVDVDGGSAGSVVVLKGKAAIDRTVTFIDDDGALNLQADFTINHSDDTLVLLCTSTDNFIELSRASNS